MYRKLNVIYVSLFKAGNIFLSETKSKTLGMGVPIHVEPWLAAFNSSAVLIKDHSR